MSGKFFGVKQNTGSVNLERLTTEGAIAAAQFEEEKRQEQLQAQRDQGAVTNQSFLTLDGGRWDDTYINSIPYDGGVW